MPFEGAEPVVSAVSLEMREARLGAGRYTDDTQMMIALAESLIEHDTIMPAALARAFCDAYDPARGYGGGTRRVISLLQVGVDVQAAARQVFDGQGSRGNGAAMRVAPIAVRFARAARRMSSPRSSAAIAAAWTTEPGDDGGEQAAEEDRDLDVVVCVTAALAAASPRSRPAPLARSMSEHACTRQACRTVRDCGLSKLSPHGVAFGLAVDCLLLRDPVIHAVA